MYSTASGHCRYVAPGAEGPQPSSPPAGASPGRFLTRRRLHASLHPELRARLTPSKLRALDLIAEGGGPRIGGLADRLGVDDKTATRMVDRLEGSASPAGE
ncbi:MAG TPA: MarR family transcriptional regulator, partial [Gaiellaceae bacterium]|nr:MarR family transcriptional regulator [Gaiellaceae bacterium]